MLELLVRNWPLKLLSLALAFSLWVTVTGVNQIPKIFTVPLEIALGDGHTLLGLPPTTGTVRVRGPESALRGIDGVGMELLVDLSETTPGEKPTVQLGKENLVGLPSGVEVESITPNRLSLEVDWKVLRQLPVVPAFEGEPPEGHAFYSARVTPRPSGSSAKKLSGTLGPLPISTCSCTRWTPR